MLTYTAICDTVRRYLEAHPDAVDEEIRAHVTPLFSDLDSKQTARAIATVRRARRAEEEPTGHIVGTIGPDVVPQEFCDAYARVCRTSSDKRVNADQRREFYELLKDFDLDVLEATGVRLAQTSHTWPRVVDWRKMANLILAERTPKQQPLPQVTTDEAGNPLVVYECHRCADTGFRPDCGCPVPNLQNGYCSHTRSTNGLDTYRPRYRPCECRATNRTFQANHRPVYIGGK